ncbi:hypothetical protein ILUMI_04523 [Ignelater luminosus]|uniref:Uncharacterized protein n=1 Tax=Ignelater luminosus TaxID=2038154 RepID=A0A8K0D8Z0_IGNLU|nr:hypothetical protein ILUMI_04523 [Ignelater luminosus]
MCLLNVELTTRCRVGFERILLASWISREVQAEKYGHSVVRLFLYRCPFNSNEIVWGIAKIYFNKHIGRDDGGMAKAVAMWKEALEQITPATWQNCIIHIEKIIKEWWEKEILFDREDVMPLITNLSDDFSSNEDDTQCNVSE